VAGLQACVGGRWSDCVGRVEASEERCNARDDDCDGRIDEDLERSCERGCRSRCVLGVWGPCVHPRGDHDRCRARDDDDDDD
jgi:hypothetical protein